MADVAVSPIRRWGNRRPPTCAQARWHARFRGRWFSDRFPLVVCFALEVACSERFSDLAADEEAARDADDGSDSTDATSTETGEAGDDDDPGASDGAETTGGGWFPPTTCPDPHPGACDGGPPKTASGCLDWTLQDGYGANDYGRSIQVGDEGHIYVVGTVHGTARGFPDPAIANLWLSKVDGAGQIVWTTTIETPNHESPVLLVRSEGIGLYLLSMDSTRDGDGDILTRELVIRLYDDHGVLQRTRAQPMSTQDFMSSGALLPNGDLVVAGRTTGVFDPDTLVGGPTDAIVMRIDAKGEELWRRQLGTKGSDRAFSVVGTPEGRILVVGETDGALPDATNAGLEDALVIALDPDGDVAWQRQFGTASSERAIDVAVDASGLIYLAGSLGSLDPECPTQKSTFALTKMDSTGEIIWLRQLGPPEPGSAYASSLAIDAYGDVVVAGALRGAICEQEKETGERALVAKYDDGGRLKSIYTFGSGKGEGIDDIETGPEGQVYVTGNTWGDIGTTPSQGGRDLFIARLCTP